MYYERNGEVRYFPTNVPYAVYVVGQKWYDGYITKETAEHTAQWLRERGFLSAEVKLERTNEPEEERHECTNRGG